MRRFLIFLFVFTCLQATGRELPLINLTQSEGLPSNSIYDIFQDKEGYMWFATNKGMSKFNGLKFENYTTASGLADNECFFIRPDNYGRLWVGTSNGGLTFYKDGMFHSAKNTPFLRLPFNGSNTANIVSEKDSSLTIHFIMRKQFISIKGDKITVFDLSKCRYLMEHLKSPDFEIIDVRYETPQTFKIVVGNIDIDNFELLVDRDMNFISSKALPGKIILQHLVGREKEFYRLKDNILSLDYMPLAGLDKNLTMNNRVNRIFIDKRYTFLCTNRGLYTDSLQLFRDENVTTVFVDHDQNYWISTLGNGVHKLDKSFRNSEILHYDNGNSPVVFAQKIQKTLLFTTLNKSVYRWTGSDINYLYDYKKENGHKRFDVNSAHLILGENYANFCLEGVFSITNLLASKPAIHKAPYYWDVATKASFISGNYVYFKASSSLLILKMLNPEFLLQEHSQYNSTFYAYMQSMLQERQNAKREKSYAQIIHYTGQTYGWAKTDDGSVWLSTIDGMCKFTGDTLRFQPQFKKILLKEFNICKNYLFGYTPENQLLVCNRYQDSWINIDSSIANNCVWDKIYPLNDSSFLITTNDHYRTITFYPSKDRPRYSLRILENQFVPQLADYFYADGTDGYFFKNNSISKIPVKDILEKSPLPRVCFSDIKTRRNRYKADSSLTLTFSESRNIDIQYTNFSYNTDKISCEYAIVSNEHDISKWLTIDGGNINLLNVGYGDYIIRIRAKTFANNYSPVAELKMSIQKPFWFTWWFFVLVSIAFAILVLVLVRYFVKRKALENEKEIKFMKSEFTALNALMNPHFIFNSLNSVQNLINKDDKRAASEYIRTISDIIRQNMYNISYDLISLEKEMILVENYLKLEKLRFKEILTYEINIDDSIETDLIMIPPLMIQPLVENAIKYGIWESSNPDGQLKVNIYNENDSVYIDIIDNGKGLFVSADQDSDHQSTAIRNLQLRLDQLSIIHKLHIEFSISEIKDERESVVGVRSRIIIHG